MAAAGPACVILQLSSLQLAGGAGATLGAQALNPKPASPGALRQARHACAYLCQSSSASRLYDRACRLHAAVQGAKLSILAAVKDPRVKAVCLLDPVDNTVYAPVGPG